MSAVHITTIRALLLTTILMSLASETVSNPITTRMLSFTGDENPAVRTHRRRHQPTGDDKFQRVLEGSHTDGDASDAEIVSDEDTISKRRSISGSSQSKINKHITNIQHHTLFYDTARDDRSVPLQAFNKKPNNSNSVFTYMHMCMEPRMRSIFDKNGRHSEACQWMYDQDLARLSDRKIFKVKLDNEHEYIMCANGKRAELIRLSEIKTLEDAKNCTWSTFENTHHEFIYTHYKDSCKLKKTDKQRGKCKKHRGFLTIREGGKKSAQPQLKVVLRYLKPPSKNPRKPRSFWKKIEDKSKFYIYTNDIDGQPHFQNPHLGTTDPPNPHTPPIGHVSRPTKPKHRRKNCNNLLMNNVNCERRRGHRRNKKVSKTLLGTQSHTVDVQLIQDSPRRHQSFLDADNERK